MVKASDVNKDIKYYTAYSVMKESIKQDFKIRRAKKQGEFFDENGVINDEKLPPPPL